MNCRICNTETDPFLNISTDQLDEPFLDAALRASLPELKLRRCTNCGCLWAHDARRDEGVLRHAYERVAGSYFESPQDNQSYAQFYKKLDQFLKLHVSGRRILDVGCGDGVFLSCISDEWLRQGLEPSASGVTLARQKNLDVQQATLDTVQDKYEVDVISALDVVEHVVDPHQFLESFKPHLRPGGVVLLLTGDADSYPARIAGPHWSYLRWCGHISVLSRTGLRTLLQSHGFEILAWDRCDHPSTSGAVAWWRVHLLEPARRLLGRNRSWYPFWRDHQMVVARLSQPSAVHHERIS